MTLNDIDKLIQLYRSGKDNYTDTSYEHYLWTLINRVRVKDLTQLLQYMHGVMSPDDARASNILERLLRYKIPDMMHWETTEFDVNGWKLTTGNINALHKIFKDNRELEILKEKRLSLSNSIYEVKSGIYLVDLTRYIRLTEVEVCVLRSLFGYDYIQHVSIPLPTNDADVYNSLTYIMQEGLQQETTVAELARTKPKKYLQCNNEHILTYRVSNDYIKFYTDKTAPTDTEVFAKDVRTVADSLKRKVYSMYFGSDGNLIAVNKQGVFV